MNFTLKPLTVVQLIKKKKGGKVKTVNYTYEKERRSNMDRPTIINPPRMDDKELRDRTLAVIDSQYKCITKTSPLKRGISR